MLLLKSQVEEITMGKLNITGAKARSKNTKASYDHQWGNFVAYHNSSESEEDILPTSEKSILNYLNYLVQKQKSTGEYVYKPTSIKLIIAAIRAKNIDEGHTHLRNSQVIANSMQQVIGVCYDNGITWNKQSYPMLTKDIKNLIAYIDELPSSKTFSGEPTHSSILACRAKAIILMMWSGALRESELINLKLTDVKIKTTDDNEEYLEIFISKSKADKKAEGTYISVFDYGNKVGGTGAVSYYKMWLGLRTSSRMQNKRWGLNNRLFLLTSKTGLEASIVGKYSGFEKHYSTHSFRTGYAVQAAASGVSLPLLQKHLRHASTEMTAKYYRNLDNKKAGQSISNIMC